MTYQKNNSDFVGARSTFQDKTKDGKDKLTMFLGTEDVRQLIEKLTAVAQAPDGVKFVVIVTPKDDGKVRGSILVSDGAKTGGAPRPGAATPTVFKPKQSYAFQPKKPVIGK